MRNLITFGSSRIEKMLNMLFYVVVVIALASLGYALLMKVATKFYSVVLFNFAYATILLHLRNTYLEMPPKYENIKKELLEGGADKELVENYIKNLREWGVFSDWLKLTVGLVLIFIFVFWLIP